KPGHLDLHLFALESRGNSYHGDDDVGLFGGGNGFTHRVCDNRQPDQPRAKTAARVLNPDLVTMSLFQSQCDCARSFIMQSDVVDNKLVVKPHPVHGTTQPYHVLARLSGREKTCPAHREVAQTLRRFDRGCRWHAQFQVNVLVITDHDWIGREILSRKVLRLESRLAVGS